MDLLNSFNEYDINNKNKDELRADYNRFDALSDLIYEMKTDNWDRRDDCSYNQTDRDNYELLSKIRSKMLSKLVKMLRRMRL